MMASTAVQRSSIYADCSLYPHLLENFVGDITNIDIGVCSMLRFLWSFILVINACLRNMKSIFMGPKNWKVHNLAEKGVQLGVWTKV